MSRRKAWRKNLVETYVQHFLLQILNLCITPYL